MQTPEIATERHLFRLLPDMRQLLETFFADVAAATRRVDVECFIVNDGGLGLLLADALGAAAARGCQVRLLYDVVGSNETDEAFFDDLRERGVEVRGYRGALASIAGKGSLITRDHGRVMVVDDHAYTGGAAWGDQWLPAELGGLGWHDVCSRVHGPIVEAFQAVFERRWHEADGSLEPIDLDTGDRYSDLRLLADSPTGLHLTYDAHLQRIDEARERIWIANAYFYPPHELLAALDRAARRGVDVRVIVPGESDLPLLKRAARSEYRDWLQRGLRVWEYEPTVMHSKYCVVDDDWASVGTFNMNASSLLWVNEVNLVVFDRDCVAEVAQQFVRDLLHSRPILLADLEAASLAQRAADAVAALVLDAADAVR
jgi:cardiolipin synthase